MRSPWSPARVLSSAGSAGGCRSVPARECGQGVASIWVLNQHQVLCRYGSSLPSETLVSLMWCQFGPQRDEINGALDPRNFPRSPPTMAGIMVNKADNTSSMKNTVRETVLRLACSGAKKTSSGLSAILPARLTTGVAKPALTILRP